jgi:hypothetical protein
VQDARFLIQGSKLLFKMPESGLKRLAVARMGCRGKFSQDAAAGKLQTPTLTRLLLLLQSQAVSGRRSLP